MNEKIDKISVYGYKSIKELESFELKDINIFIGANGAGKSNFLSIFKFLLNIYKQNLGFYTAQNGLDSILYYGRKTTENLAMEFVFNKEINKYKFSLIPNSNNRFIFEEELAPFYFQLEDFEKTYPNSIEKGHEESKLKDSSNESARYVRDAINNWRIYHFHDTGKTAKVKGQSKIRDNEVLKEDGENLASFLLRLKKDYKFNYDMVIDAIKAVAPFFDDFYFRDENSEDLDTLLQLEWKEVGDFDTVFGANDLSDGTLRFICLATLLLQPDSLMPATIIIDEPELGLHPYALADLAVLIQRASDTTQLIIASQSVELINHFQPQDIVITNRVSSKEKLQTTFERLDEDDLKVWLEDYSLGELWNTNLLKGTPL